MTTTPRLSVLNMVSGRQGGSLLGVIAKRTYQVRGGRCLVADQQVPLAEKVVMSPDQTMLLQDLDPVLNRKHVDLILLGHAYSYGPRAHFELGIRVGELARRIHVSGERSVYRDRNGQLRFSPPQPFERVSLDWSSAYGGADLVALRKYGDPIQQIRREVDKPYDPRFGSYSYPRNRAGKGYLIEPSEQAIAACSLPNLELLSNLLTPETLPIGRFDRWPKGPLVAGTGYLGYHYFPRCAMMGVLTPFDRAICPDSSFAELQMGVLHPRVLAERAPIHDRIDIAFAQQAALGMRMAQLDPGTPVELTSVHPSQPVWSFALPREMPRLALKLPDGPPQALVPQIRSIVFEPERDQLCITWVGEQRTAVPIGPGKFSKIAHAVAW